MLSSKSREKKKKWTKKSKNRFCKELNPSLGYTTKNTVHIRSYTVRNLKYGTGDTAYRGYGVYTVIRFGPTLIIYDNSLVLYTLTFELSSQVAHADPLQVTAQVSPASLLWSVWPGCSRWSYLVLAPQQIAHLQQLKEQAVAINAAKQKDQAEIQALSQRAQVSALSWDAICALHKAQRRVVPSSLALNLWSLNHMPICLLLLSGFSLTIGCV